MDELISESVKPMRQQLQDLMSLLASQGAIGRGLLFFKVKPPLFIRDQAILAVPEGFERKLII